MPILKVLVALVFVVVADRAIPRNVRAVAGDYFTASREEFWRTYGVVSFPRTLFAVVLCVSAGLDSVFPTDAVGYAMVLIALIYAVSVGVDTYRAGRPRGWTHRA